MMAIHNINKRSFDHEFSANWVCKAKSRTLPTECVDRVCQNGGCMLNDYEGENVQYGTCQCDPGWTGRLCQHCCDLPCKNGGTCQVEGDHGLPFCNCAMTENKMYTGPLCEDRRESERLDATDRGSEPYHKHLSGWELPVLACSSVVIVFVLLSVFIVLLMLYRRRHPGAVQCCCSSCCNRQNEPQYIHEVDERFDSFVSCDIRDGIIKKDFALYKDQSLKTGNPDGHVSHTSTTSEKHTATDKLPHPVVSETIQDGKWSMLAFHPPPPITQQLKEATTVSSENSETNTAIIATNK